MTPMQAIRKHCVDCCGSTKTVKFCTCDGVHSTRCDLWPFRFGKRPATAARKYGKQLLDPALMPSADVSLEEVEVVGVGSSLSGGVVSKKVG